MNHNSAGLWSHKFWHLFSQIKHPESLLFTLKETADEVSPIMILGGEWMEVEFVHKSLKN